MVRFFAQPIRALIYSQTFVYFLDGRREYTDDDLGSPGEKLAGSKEHFLYTEVQYSTFC